MPTGETLGATLIPRQREWIQGVWRGQGGERGRWVRGGRERQQCAGRELLGLRMRFVGRRVMEAEAVGDGGWM